MRTARALTVVSGAALALVMTAGTASAHECFIANRGGTPHSEGWFSVDVDGAVAEWLEAGIVTSEQAACLTDALPSTIALKVKGANGSGGVLMANNPNAPAKAADGKGVDHVGAYFAACGIELPEE